MFFDGLLFLSSPHVFILGEYNILGRRTLGYLGAVHFTFIPSGSEERDRGSTNLAATVSIRRENWEIKIPLPFSFTATSHALSPLIKSSLSHSQEQNSSSKLRDSISG